MKKTILFSLILLISSLTTFGQARRDPDQGKTIEQVEKELAQLAQDILNHDDTDYKFNINKEFINRLTNLLERPESYDYPFELLETVSILKPTDNAFRIFTWYIVDKPKDAYYSELAHYYFGLIQRKFIGQNEKTHYLVIPLMELERIPKGFENIVTDNFAWFGALYYQPKHFEGIPHYDSYYYKLIKKDDGEVGESEEETELVYTFNPAKYRSRTLKEVKKLKYANHERVKEDVRYYVLTGWNGWDNKSNYKVFDILSFDPQDSMKAVFGAPIIYFDRIPKARALFKYSDYSAFSLNASYVKSGFMNMGKQKMFVYDHMANPNATRETEVWEQGPDGTYDALSWYKKYGYFEWYRDVEIAEKFDSKQHAKEVRRLQMIHLANDSIQSWVGPDGFDQQGKKVKRYKKNQKELDQQAEKANSKTSGAIGEAKKEE